MSYGYNLQDGGRNPDLAHDIEQALTVLLFTRPGERIYDPLYGCEVLNLLDRPVAVAQTMLVSVYDAVTRYEPRVTLLMPMTIPAIDAEAGAVTLTLRYRINETGEVVENDFSNKQQLRGAAINYNGVLTAHDVTRRLITG